MLITLHRSRARRVVRRSALVRPIAPVCALSCALHPRLQCWALPPFEVAAWKESDSDCQRERSDTANSAARRPKRTGPRIACDARGETRQRGNKRQRARVQPCEQQRGRRGQRRKTAAAGARKGGGGGAAGCASDACGWATVDQHAGQRRTGTSANSACTMGEQGERAAAEFSLLCAATSPPLLSDQH